MICLNCGSDMESTISKMEMQEGESLSYTFVPHWGCPICGAQVLLDTNDLFDSWINEYMGNKDPNDLDNGLSLCTSIDQLKFNSVSTY